MCMKAGLTELGKYILSDWAYKETQKNENAHELGKMLCIDKGRLKRLKDINGDGKILKWLQEEKRNNTIYRDEDIRTLCEADIYPEDTKRKKSFSISVNTQSLQLSKKTAGVQKITWKKREYALSVE